MNATRYYVRNTVTGLYWDGGKFSGLSPVVPLTGPQLAVLRATYLNVESAPVPPLPDDVREAFRSWSASWSQHKERDWTRGDKIRLGQRAAKMSRLIRRHGLDDAATMFRLSNPERFGEAV